MPTSPERVAPSTADGDWVMRFGGDGGGGDNVETIMSDTQGEKWRQIDSIFDDSDEEIPDEGWSRQEVSCS